MSSFKKMFIAVMLFVTSVFGYAASPYYVDASRPDDSGDGTNWSAAKKTIQAAIDLTHRLGHQRHV